MLVLASFQPHCIDVVKACLLGTSMDFVIVPDGMITILELLDICLNMLFRSHGQRLFTQWMADSLYALTLTGGVWRPDVALLYQ